MYLRTLVVNGFKSFVETKLDFPKGITAVVGPNGTGKSNIVDAILWAMGEQSVKSLRSERMEDVIFNGTEQRKPLGMVEASLVFSDVSPRDLEPISAILEDLDQPTEIMLTRRLFRDGESEYLLNKIPCRLKDIRGFLWNVRAGTRGQSVIEQGNIEQLLNASPQERREFIEGTAGIIRYKKQKAEALRKLEGTENNLLRVRDILGEVRQQLKTLNRQAKQAEEYQALQREARELEVRILSLDFRKLFHQQQGFEAELQESEHQELACVAEEARFAAEREEHQLALTATGEALAETQEQLRDVDRQLSQGLTTIQIERHRLEQLGQQHEQVMDDRRRLEGESQTAQAILVTVRERMAQIRCEIESISSAVAEGDEKMTVLAARRKETAEIVEHGRERILGLAVEQTNLENRLQMTVTGQHALQRRLERLDSEMLQTQSAQVKLHDEGKTLLQQRVSLEGQLEDLKKNQEELEVTLQSQRESREDIDEKLLELQTQMAGTDSEWRALQGIFQEELGYGAESADSESSVRGNCSAIQAALAERMEVPERVEKAIEAALGRQLRAWLVQSPQEAEQTIGQFKLHRLGRGSFIPLNLYQPREAGQPAWWSAIESDPRVQGLAVDRVQVDESLQGVVCALLGQTVIVDTLAGALALMETQQWFHGQGPLLATLEGELVYSSGVIIGGSDNESGGLLHRRREILELEQRLQNLSLAVEAVKLKRKDLCENIESVSQQLEAATSGIRETEIQWVTVQREGASREQALPELEKRLEILSYEQETEGTELTRMQHEEEDLRQRLTDLEKVRAQEDLSLREGLASLEALNLEYQVLLDSVNEVRVNYQTLKTRWDHEQGQVERIEREEDNRKNRLVQIDQQLEQLFAASRKSQDERLKTEEQVEWLQEKQDELAEELRKYQNRHAGITQQVKQCENLMAECRDTLSKILKTRVPIESHLAEVRTKLQGVREMLEVTYEMGTDELVNLQNENPVQGEESISAAEGMASPEAWREQLQQIRKRLERIGPINLAAIEEHQQLEERYQFLLAQESDLANSIQSLQEIIQRLNHTTNRLFDETFQELQVKFSEVFSALFAGGRAELVLVEETVEGADGEVTRLEPGVDIVAQPPGKRLKNLSMLSGGEKTLTVMALLFASFLIRPSPFCVLDEVDAPLDENNVVRFGQFLRQMADCSQFVLITHNKRSMEIADSLFGVTMEEPGVSKLVSVRLQDLQEVG
ncbi:MAG: chromosome segregation protein SMC [Nitrospirales bacterium]|nr:chromosome segregation protein SMC [Nitrospirales bacterium]